MLAVIKLHALVDDTNNLGQRGFCGCLNGRISAHEMYVETGSNS